MAEPVLLISSDPYLGVSLEAVAHGRIQVAHLDPAYRPPTWPAPPEATVVLDVTSRQRDSVHTWVRVHHPGLPGHPPQTRRALPRLPSVAPRSLAARSA